jgi:hypothetical protein
VNNIEYEEQMVAWDSGEEELEEEWSMDEFGKILDCVLFFNESGVLELKKV